MSSLDISRRNLALRGRETFEKVMELAEYARSEINEIPGFYAFSKELINGDSVFDFDVTKLSVHTLEVRAGGIEVYDLLRDEYADIQINSEISAMCWHTFPLETESGTLSVWFLLFRDFPQIREGKGGFAGTGSIYRPW